MDAGVPIKRPSRACAMGLIKDEETGKVAVLTDIQGLEDFLGDMDFKVAGTKNGITAIQMDIKIKGIDEPILRQALAQAYDGRMHILGKMLEACPSPGRSSPVRAQDHHLLHQPRQDPRGHRLRRQGHQQDHRRDGRQDRHRGRRQRVHRHPRRRGRGQGPQIIEGIAKDVEVGEVYTGKVVRIMHIGAFVELLPGKDGMLHISKLANERVEKVEDVLNIGDEVKVRVSGIDSQGRVNLVRADMVIEEKPRAPRHDRGERRDRGDRGEGPKPNYPFRSNGNRRREHSEE